jgi:hypothetical protein
MVEIGEETKADPSPEGVEALLSVLFFLGAG